jgi:hypothetical protein
LSGVAVHLHRQTDAEPRIAKARAQASRTTKKIDSNGPAITLHAFLSNAAERYERTGMATRSCQANAFPVRRERCDKFWIKITDFKAKPTENRLLVLCDLSIVGTISLALANLYDVGDLENLCDARHGIDPGACRICIRRGLGLHALLLSVAA